MVTFSPQVAGGLEKDTSEGGENRFPAGLAAMQSSSSRPEGVNAGSAAQGCPAWKRGSPQSYALNMLT